MPASSVRARLGECLLIVGLAGSVTLGTAVAAHAGHGTPTVHVAAASDGAQSLRPAHPPAAQAAAAHRHAAAAHKQGAAARKRAAVGRARAEAAKVLALAKRLRGRPYVWGAAGPHAFDCSGLVQYVFRHAIGKHLPRSTWAQWAAIKHIRRWQLKPGDLVYVRGLWHVGIYAGKGYWWEAPHTGSHVKKRRIWAHHLRFGRVIPRG